MKWDELTPLGLLFVCYLIIDKYLFNHSLSKVFWTGCREYYCLLWNRLFPGHPLAVAKRPLKGRPASRKRPKSLTVLETRQFDRGLLRTITDIEKERKKAEKINATFTAEQQEENDKKRAQLPPEREHLAFDDSREIIEQDPDDLITSDDTDQEADDYAEREESEDDAMSYDEFRSVIALSNGQLLPDDRIEKARRGLKGISNTKLSAAVLAQMQKIRGQAAEQIRKVVTYDEDTKSANGSLPDKRRKGGE